MLLGVSKESQSLVHQGGVLGRGGAGAGSKGKG